MDKFIIERVQLIVKIWIILKKLKQKMWIILEMEGVFLNSAQHCCSWILLYLHSSFIFVYKSALDLSSNEDR